MVDSGEKRKSESGQKAEGKRELRETILIIFDVVWVDWYDD